MPPATNTRCTYVADWVATTLRRHLSADPTETAAWTTWPKAARTHPSTTPPLTRRSVGVGSEPRRAEVFADGTYGGSVVSFTPALYPLAVLPVQS